MLPTFRVREVQSIPADSIGDAPPQLLRVLSSRPYLVAAAILLGTFLCFASGLDNLPVAEDYSNRWEDLRGNGAGQLRPAFALVSIAAAVVVGTPYEAPALHHFALLLAHMTSVFLVFLIARRLTSSSLAAAASAFFFALYPRHHEPVLWPAASMHTMMVLLGLLSFYCYLRAREARARSWFIASVAFFGASILSSEAGAVFIGLILAYELLWRQPQAGAALIQYGRALLRTALPYVVLAGCYLGVLLLLRGPLDLVTTSPTTSEYHLALSPTKLKDLGGYLSYSLFAYVPLRSIDSVAVKLVMLLVTASVYGVAFLFGSRFVRFGLCWAVLAVTPYALLVPFGNADRYFYLASIGIAFAAAGIIAKLVQLATTPGRSYRYGIGLLTVLLMVSYAVSSILWINARSHEWERAGAITDGLLRQVQSEHPQVEASTTFYFVDLPLRYGHVPVLHWGIHRALQEHYQDDDLRVYSTTDPNVTSVVRSAASTCCHSADTYIYLYEDGELVDISARFADPTVRSLLLALEPPP